MPEEQPAAGSFPKASNPTDELPKKKRVSWKLVATLAGIGAVCAALGLTMLVVAIMWLRPTQTPKTTAASAAGPPISIRETSAPEIDDRLELPLSEVVPVEPPPSLVPALAPTPPPIELPSVEPPAAENTVPKLPEITGASPTATPSVDNEAPTALASRTLDAERRAEIDAVELPPLPPSDEELQQARQRVRAAYKDRLAAAKSPLQKKQLADLLLGDAAATSEDRANRFALLETAREAFAQAGDIGGVFKTAELAAEDVAVDGFELKRAALPDVARQCRSVANRRARPRRGKSGPRGGQAG